MVKKMRDTTPTKVATMTMYSAMFTKDVVENIEKKINEYEKRLKLSNDDVNKLFIENIKLKQQLQQETIVRGAQLVICDPSIQKKDPQIQQMRDEIDKLKKHNMEDVKHHIMQILRKILEHRVKILKEKINILHESFNNLIKALEKINANSPILEELKEMASHLSHTVYSMQSYKQGSRFPIKAQTYIRNGERCD